VPVRLDTALSAVVQRWFGCSNTSQFVGATCSGTAKAGAFTSLPEHYAEWKTHGPPTRKDVAADLRVAELDPV
jgi:hypothetical protein